VGAAAQGLENLFVHGIEPVSRRTARAAIVMKPGRCAQAVAGSARAAIRSAIQRSA